MNENIPTPDPNEPPPVPAEYKLPPPNPGAPPSATTVTQPPGVGACIGLGVLLCIVTTALCFLIPPAILVGLGVAITSLFFKGYRGVALGFFLTIGVALLGAIVYCSTHPFRMD